MAKKNIKILINDIETDITIRRIKFKETKNLAIKIVQKLDDFIKYFDNKNIFDELDKLIIENIDFIAEGVILPFTNITKEQFGEMDIVDIIDLVKALFEYNNIDSKKIINFLLPNKATINNPLQKFGEIPLPSQN